MTTPVDSKSPLTTLTPDRGLRRRPRVAVVLLFLAIMAVLCIGLIEVGLRLFAPIEFAEFLEYEIDGHIRVRPIAGQLIDNGEGCKVRINRDGFRGPDYAYDKPPGTLRLQVYGGSAAFDFRASAEEKSWPGAVQIILAEKLAMPVEVINLAVPGFDAFNGKINYLYNGRNYHPDVAILYETWNDMGQYRALEKGPYRSGASALQKPLWERVARQLQIGRRAVPIVRAIQGRRLDDITKAAADSADLERPADPKILAWDRRNFEDFVRFTRDDGVLPVLVSMAFLGSEESLKDPEIRRTIAAGCVQRGFTPERATETLVTMSNILKEVADANGAIFIDGYRAVPHDLKHIRDNVHFFDAGSAKLAEAVARGLLTDSRFMKVVERVRAEGRR